MNTEISGAEPEKYFTLTDGVLELYSDKIIIFDKAKRNRISIIFATICGLAYSIACIVRGYKSNDGFWLYFGIALTLLWTTILLIRKKEFRKIDNEIKLNDILKVTFNNGWRNESIAKMLTRENIIRKITIEKKDMQDKLFEDELRRLNIKIISK